MTYDEVQIRSKSAIIYSAYARTGNSGSFESAQSIENRVQNSVIKETVQPSVKPYSGKMTVGAKKRLTKALSLFVQSSKQRYVYNTVTQRKQLFQLAFITLTVAETEQMYSAKEAHKMLLEPFLLYLRRKHQVVNYVWKAELQERGQIHYHITIDQFIAYTDIRDTWNNLQYKNGLLENYHSKFGTYSPNGTDIHSVKKIKNFERYMVKYMSKVNKDDASTDGKVWDCSVCLKRSKYYTTSLTYGMERTIQYIQDHKMATVQHFDHYSMVVFNTGNASYLLEKDSLMEYKGYMSKINKGVVDKPKEIPISIPWSPIIKVNPQYTLI